MGTLPGHRTHPPDSGKPYRFARSHQPALESEHPAQDLLRASLGRHIILIVSVKGIKTIDRDGIDAVVAGYVYKE